MRVVDRTKVVLLVVLSFGCDCDGVVASGLDRPVQQAEIFDPETETWKRMASSNNPRTYHNTAMLMPDGRVLVDE